MIVFYIMTYDFLAIDEGKKQLLKGSTAKADFQWNIDLKDYPLSRALQRIDDDTILVGYSKGYFLVSLSRGEVLKSFSEREGVTAARKLNNGKTMLCGLDLGDKKGITLQLLGENDSLSDEIAIKGHYVRLVTALDSGYFLSVNRKIIETDLRLNEIRRYKAFGFRHAWKALPLKDGRVLVSAGYGAFMAVFSSEGKLIRKFGRKKDVPDEVRPYFYASFDLDEQGNILVANWQGHGPNRGDSGRQLIKFSPKGNYLESWSWPQTISSLQGFMLLP